MAVDIRIAEEQTTEKRAGILGLEYTDTSKIVDKRLFPQLLNKEDMYAMRVIPLEYSKNGIDFGITTTTSQQTMKQLTQQFLDHRVLYKLISETGYNDYMKLYDPPKKVVYKDITISNDSQTDLISQVTATLDQIRADDMLAYLTSQAHKLGASDIHVENQPSFVRIRIRIDGVLHPIAKISHERSRMLTSSIASAANISTSSNTSQQGHITQKVVMADKSVVNINLRVESVPAINGMDIVMRLFNMEASNYTLDRLGLNSIERSVVDNIIKKPNGLVLAVGPTGSGKTTTLYSMLNTLNIETRKIITIEDPVEYQFDGITQISVTSETSDESNFADKLRAVLRLDPDVVMVGEIRDNDTAKTALQASLTGHLVLSTFHAGSSAQALTRMVDIIGQNPLFTSAIRLIMAQRLVRKLDNDTKIAYDPDEATKKQISDIIQTLPAIYMKPDISNFKLYKPGSSKENPFGYKGQIAIREQMVMSDELRALLSKPSAEITSQLIESTAIEAGMLTMLHNAVFKLLSGETTYDEVFRVLG